MRPRLMLVLTAPALAQLAHAQLSVTSQTRRVFAKAQAATMLGGPVVLVQQSEFIAPDFGPFHETALAEVQSVWASGKGFASQDSSLGTAAITVSGVTEAWTNYGPAATTGQGDAEFVCSIGFDVPAPLPVHLALSLLRTGGAQTGESWTVATLYRQTPSGPVFIVYRETNAAIPSASFDGPLLLEPGSYIVGVGSQCHPGCIGTGSACSGHIRNDMSLSLTVCYPDCTIDGALTVADFGCFQTRFAASDPYADCNADSALTVADFGCFQTRFVQGCPPP